MRGSCLCGEIEYEVSQLDSSIGHCSCRTCRKAHAAAFNTSASVAARNFRWLKGTQTLKAFESSPGKKRYFCASCGSHVVAQHAGSERLILRVATLDEDPGHTPERHIWASHEVPWLAYGPQVPAFEGWAPEHD